MRKWGPTLIAAIAVLGNVFLGAIAAAQNAQLIGVIISARYLKPDYLLGGFGVALLLVYLAAKATHPAPAAIRLKYVGLAGYPFELTNVGQTEANEIMIQAIQSDTCPWAAEFHEVGSIPPTNLPELPRAAIVKRELVDACADCTNHGKPGDVEQLLLGLGDHLGHVAKLKGKNASYAESQYEITRLGGLSRRFSVFIQTTFYDGRSTESAHHRVDIEYTQQTLHDANTVFLRRRSRGATARISES